MQCERTEDKMTTYVDVNGANRTSRRVQKWVARAASVCITSRRKSGSKPSHFMSETEVGLIRVP